MTLDGGLAVFVLIGAICGIVALLLVILRWRP